MMISEFFAKDGLQWLAVQVFVIIFITAIIQKMTLRALSKIHKRTHKTSVVYDAPLVEAAYTPANFLIWMFGLSLSVSLITDKAYHFPLSAYIPEIQKVSIVVAIAWLVLRFVARLETQYIKHCDARKKNIDVTLTHAIAQLISISTIVTATLLCMQIVGLPIAGLLAFGGIGGAAVAFAAKDLLANIFGSLVIYLDKPFKVGDWIRSPDKSIEGIVEFIGWRATKIRNFEKRPLYVPNGVFLTITVENPSRMSSRRIKESIGIRYCDASYMDTIVNQVKDMLVSHPDIDNDQIIVVNFDTFGASSLNFLVYAFTKTTNWVQFKSIQHKIFIKILEIIQKNGAECAFPTQTLFIQNDSAETKALNARNVCENHHNDLA
ncbi:MAG: mechanosensitive ion channel family protein [Gammaproteobacteria bacterium]|nr:mechanosensitive ion channel family protein [Gammaproteobacteria bacterium]